MASAATPRLAAFWDQAALSIGHADFQQIDVALAAMVCGEWARFERRLSEGLACVARAAVEHVLPGEDALDEVATAFRYERDLIAGSDMSAWLERVELSADDWMAFLTRDLLRRRWAAELPTVVDQYPPSPRQLRAAAVAEGICSGLFRAFHETFSGRAALAYDADASLLDAGRSRPSAYTEAATQIAGQHHDWLLMRPEPDTLARLVTLLDVEHVYAARCAQLVSEAALSAVVDAHRLEWVMLDVDTLSFDDEDAAREAVLCVRADGLSLHDVGALSRRPVTRSHVFLAELPSELRDRLLSTDAGRPVGPLCADGKWQVIVVAARTSPSLEDDRVVIRARQTLLEQACRRAARQHAVNRARV